MDKIGKPAPAPIITGIGKREARLCPGRHPTAQARSHMQRRVSLCRGILRNRNAITLPSIPQAPRQIQQSSPHTLRSKQAHPQSQPSRPRRGSAHTNKGHHLGNRTRSCIGRASPSRIQRLAPHPARRILTVISPPNTLISPPNTPPTVPRTRSDLGVWCAWHSWRCLRARVVLHRLD